MRKSIQGHFSLFRAYNQCDHRPTIDCFILPRLIDVFHDGESCIDGRVARGNGERRDQVR